MLTLADLKIERETTLTGEGAAIWDIVTTPDNRKFLVGSCDYTTLKEVLELAATGVETERPEGYTDEDILAFLMGWVPVKETWVMEAKLEDGVWVPANECGEHCETGVCNKRLATDTENASQDHGYKMLLDALNA